MQLDVIITQRNDKFEAKSPLFPNCRGNGNTEAQALEALSNSISRQIAKNTKELLSESFTAKNYNEIITNPIDRKGVQHRVFDLSKQKLPFQKSVMLKLNNLPELKFFRQKKKETTETPSHDWLDSLKQEPVKPDEMTMHKSAISVHDHPVQTTDDGFIFGIPLSLN